MQNKKTMKSYGGITKKYEREIGELAFVSMSLTLSLEEVAYVLRYEKPNLSDLQSHWLNGTYRVLQQVENIVVKYESQVKDDPQFSDKSKQQFIHDVIEPVKNSANIARECDAQIMSGRIPEDLCR